MTDSKLKKLRPMNIVGDQPVEPASVATKPPVPMTLQLLDDYVSKLAQFERKAIIGQDVGLQPPQLASLSDLHAIGKSAFRFKKPDSDREKLAGIVASLLKKTEGS